MISRISSNLNKCKCPEQIVNICKIQGQTCMVRSDMDCCVLIIIYVHD